MKLMRLINVVSIKAWYYKNKRIKYREVYLTLNYKNYII